MDGWMISCVSGYIEVTTSISVSLILMLPLHPSPGFTPQISLIVCVLLTDRIWHHGEQPCDVLPGPERQPGEEVGDVWLHHGPHRGKSDSRSHLMSNGFLFHVYIRKRAHSYCLERGGTFSEGDWMSLLADTIQNGGGRFVHYQWSRLLTAQSFLLVWGATFDVTALWRAAIILALPISKLSGCLGCRGDSGASSSCIVGWIACLDSTSLLCNAVT